MRIAIVTDIHKGGLIECRPGAEANGLLNKFLDVCKERNVDLILELGDRVNNHSNTSDISNLKDVIKTFDTVDIPVLHAFGNHDVHYMSKSENMDLLKMDAPYYTKIIGDYEFIVIDTADPVYDDCGGTISDEQGKWFENELLKAEKPVIVVSHHPLYDQEQDGNPFFVPLPGQYKVVNNQKYIDMIVDSGKVKACFNGHVHWMYATLRKDTVLVSVPSLLENYPLKAGAPGAFAIVDMDEFGRIVTSFETLNPRRTIGKYDYVN